MQYRSRRVRTREIIAMTRTRRWQSRAMVRWKCRPDYLGLTVNSLTKIGPSPNWSDLIPTSRTPFMAFTAKL